MSLDTDLTFLQKYHKDIIWLLAGCLVVFGVFYVKDRLHNASIAKENEQISNLKVEAIKLTAAKDAASAEAANTFNLYQQEHAKLISALSKKPIVVSTPVVPNSATPVVPLPQLPDSPVPTTLPDCQQELAAVKADDNQCIDTVNTLQTEKVADQALLNNQAQTIINVDTENTQLAKDVATQTKRKKLWRDFSLLEAGSIILHFLL